MPGLALILLTQEDFVTEETWDPISDINTVAKKDMGDSLIDMITNVTMDQLAKIPTKTLVFSARD